MGSFWVLPSVTSLTGHSVWLFTSIKFPTHSFGLSQKKILKAQQSSPKPQVVVATIDVDTPPRQQTPEVKKTPEVQQKPEVVVKQEVVASTSSASTSSASTSKAATRYVYRVEEYYHRRCFRHLTMFFFFTLCPSSAVVESKSKDT